MNISEKIDIRHQGRLGFFSEMTSGGKLIGRVPATAMIYDQNLAM